MHEFGLLVLRMAHDVTQVFPFKTHAEHVPVLGREAEPVAYIVDDRRRGRGRKRQYGHTRRLADIGDFKVGRPEVIPPLGDAVLPSSTVMKATFMRRSLVRKVSVPMRSGET